MTKQLFKALNLAPSSTTTSSGAEITITGNGAVRVDPSSVAQYRSAKSQIAALGKVMTKQSGKASQSK